MRPVRSMLLFLISATCLIACQMRSSIESDRWEWHAEDIELYTPALSPDGSQVAMVMKRYVPDGDEAEELSEANRAAMQKSRDLALQSDPRSFDPQIVVVDRTTQKESKIDFGWDPVFFPDGKSIAYSHQKVAISRFRVLAQTLKGNEIRIANLRAKTVETIAVPSEGHLAEPQVSNDGTKVIYTHADAVNGAYAGNVGIGIATIADKSNSVLYPRSLQHGLTHLVLQLGFVGTEWCAIRAVPTSTGDYLAESYRVDLVSLSSSPTVVATWGEVSNLEISSRRFAQGANSRLLVYDGSWHELPTRSTSVTTAADYKEPGLLSPDGKWIARPNGTSVELVAMNSGKVHKSWYNDSEADGVTWARDSRKIGWVARGSMERFRYDTLVVVTLPE